MKNYIFSNGGIEKLLNFNKNSLLFIKIDMCRGSSLRKFIVAFFGH